jgi:hypothetical protein
MVNVDTVMLDAPDLTEESEDVSMMDVEMDNSVMDVDMVDAVSFLFFLVEYLLSVTIADQAGTRHNSPTSRSFARARPLSLPRLLSPTLCRPLSKIQPWRLSRAEILG